MITLKTHPVILLQTNYPDTGSEYTVAPELGPLEDVARIVVTLTAKAGETPYVKDFQAHYCEEAGNRLIELYI